MVMRRDIYLLGIFSVAEKSGMLVLTSVEVHGIDEHTIGAQLSAVVDDVEVDGVKIGSGRGEPSTRPAGSSMPLTAPVARYSPSPPPVR